MAANRQAAIASAEKLVAKGRVELAIKEYRKLLSDNPNDASTLNRLGDLYARIDKIDDAVRLFSQIAERYTEDGFFVKAIAIFKKIIKLDPTRLAVYERLAELYHKQGLVTEARTQYQVLVDYYQKHGNTTSAIGVLENMIELEPSDPSPHVKLAELYRQQDQSAKELAEYRTIADLMLQRGRIEEATQVFAKAIAVAPQDIAFITDAVLGLKDAGHAGAAARLLTVAVEKNPQAEKIARLAGLGRGARGMPPALTVNDVIGAREEPAPAREVLYIEPELIGEPPAVEEPGQQRPESRASIDAEMVLDLPMEGEPAASSQIEPTAEMMQRSPQSPWFEAEAGVEFELEIETATDEAPLDSLAAAPTAPEVAASEPAQPGATAGLPDLVPMHEGPPIDWSFEPEPELDLDLPERPAAAAPPAPAAGPPSLDLAALEKTSYEVLPAAVPAVRRLEDLLAEAEVFGKYGLREKAHDRLREILQHDGRHLGAHALQLQLWLDEGRHERVVPRVEPFARLATELGDEDTWPALRTRLEKAGYRFDGDRLESGPKAKKPKKDSVAALLEDLVGLGGRVATERPEPRAAPATRALDALAELAAQFAPTAPAKSRAPRSPELPPGPPAATQPPPPSAAAASLGEMGQSDIDVRSVPPPAPVDEGLAWLDRAATPSGPLKTPDESLFDDEEGFFDLAAELEEELSGDEALGGKSLLAPQEQSLEEIVEGFKKGVAESLSPEDYDTHFNLGIAYREMGLIDEAIGEFQIAAKDTTYLVDCCSLLGACFLDKGLPELAVRWYQKGLETPNLKEEATLGLLYDLGNLYLSIDETEKAHRTFVEIYGTNSNYRDVVAKLEELGGH